MNSQMKVKKSVEHPLIYLQFVLAEKKCDTVFVAIIEVIETIVLNVRTNGKVLLGIRQCIANGQSQIIIILF